jgi:hypothetical protein
VLEISPEPLEDLGHERVQLQPGEVSRPDDRRRQRVADVEEDRDPIAHRALLAVTLRSPTDEETPARRGDTGTTR